MLTKTPTALLDFGIADVHQTGAPMDPKKQKRQARRAAKLKGRKTVHVRADLADGGVLHVRQLADIGGVVALDGVPVTLTDDDKPVWIELAKVGVFKGHPSGPFELNEVVFSEIIRNFEKTQNRQIPIDFEHASEQGATEGSIPVIGAPAQGWIKDLKTIPGRLLGLVKWGEQARSYIKSGQYKFFSPAIRFNTKDRVTGEPSGAKMTSGALTNIPFLDGLKPLAAKDGGELIQARFETGPGEPFALKLRGAKAHSPNEFMPLIKAALKLPALASAKDCSDHLDNLRDHLDAVDGDHEATHHGVQLGDYCRPLRDMVSAPPGATWEDVFDTVEDLIDSAMDEHVLEYHTMSDEPPSAALDETKTTNDNTGPSGDRSKEGTTPMSEILMKQIADLTTATSEFKVTLADRELKLKEVNDKITAAEQKLTLSEGKVAELSVSLKEETAKRETAETELVTLKAWKEGEEKRVFDERLLEAFDCYKDARKLNDSDKEMMSVFLKSNPTAFETKFPKVSADKRHLLRNLSDGTDGKPTPTTVIDDGAPTGGPVHVNLADASLALAKHRGIPLDAAQRIVMKQFNGRATNPIPRITK